MAIDINDNKFWSNGIDTAIRILAENMQEFDKSVKKKGYRIGVIGTSLVEHHHTANSSLKLASWSRGWLNWAQVLNPGLFVFDVWYDPTVRAGWEPTGPGSTVSFRGLNAGVGGQVLSQIEERKEFLVENLDCDIIIIDGGTNDIAGSTKESIAQARQDLADYYLANGKIVVLLPILARSTASWTTASGYRKKCHWVNRKTREFVSKRNNCFLFDWNEHWIDFNSVDGDPKTGYSPDGTHYSTLSAYAVGKKFGEFLKTILPSPGSKRVTAPDDLYDATLNPLGNKMPNPMLTGTTGTIGTGASGSVATSMRVVRNSGTSTVACSKEVRADGRGNYQVMTFTPAGTAVDLFYLQTSSTDVAHSLPIGTWVRASIEVDCQAWAGWRAVSLHLRDNATGGIIAYGMEDYSEDQWPTESWTGVIQTPPFQIIDAASTLRWRVQIKVAGNAAGTGVVKVGAVELRAVEDPRVTVNYRGE